VVDPWPLVAGLSLGLVPRLVFDRDGRRRPAVATAAWVLAGAALVLQAARTQINDDEVFYLADAWAARSGETAGSLPMRYIAFLAFLLPPWPPSVSLVAGRMAMVVAAVAGALAVVRIVRRLSGSAFDASLAGALTLVWLATEAEAALLRPEQMAGAGVLVAIALLLAPPRPWPRGVVVGGAFVLLTLAASLSHRRAFLLPAAVAILLWQDRREERRADLLRALAGIALGALPSVVYVLARDSMASIWYWNWTFVRERSWVPGGGLAFRVPVFLTAVGTVAATWALRRRDEPRATVLAVFWLVLALLAVLVPFTLNYALGPWFALSFALAALMATRLQPGAASPIGQRIGALALGLLGLTPILGSGVTDSSPSHVGSELSLIDWLHEAAAGGKVMCVAPFHPIKAGNAWHMWNAWWYCYLKDPAFNRELNPGLADSLRTGQAHLIQWDPWPQGSGYRNVLAFATANGFLTRDEAREVAAGLRRDYVLVRWSRPLPPGFGGGRFLVPRGLPLDSRVVALPDQRIAP
jgi:hypothetical protein